MHKYAKRNILLIAAVVLAAALAGCGTFSFGFSSSVREAPLFQRGQVVDVQGRVGVNRNEVTLEDQNSPAVFRLVGLRPDQRRSLSGMAGQIIVIRLKVISTQSAHSYNAQLMQSSERRER